MAFFVGENREIVGQVFATALLDSTNVSYVIMAILAKVKGPFHLKIFIESGGHICHIAQR